MVAKAFKSVPVQIYPMKYCLRIEVRLKPGHSDPEGEATAQLLKELGYNIETVNVGKVYTVALEAGSRKIAETKAEEMCKRLLANPTKDDYSVNVEEKR
jgi:phosphoribosylformylglycinamidine synthase PurS subunit